MYRNFEAGKQLVIRSIDGNFSLGAVDVLTRLDLKRKFQYFLYVQLAGTFIIDTFAMNDVYSYIYSYADHSVFFF